MKDIHLVIETINMFDGSQKDFCWFSDDYNGMEEFFMSAGENEIAKVLIDGVEVPLKEAEHTIFVWEQKYLLKYGVIDKATYETNLLEEGKRYGVEKMFG